MAYVSHILCVVVSAIVAGFLQFSFIVDLCSVAALAAFVLVCASVIQLRFAQDRKYKTGVNQGKNASVKSTVLLYVVGCVLVAAFLVFTKFPKGDENSGDETQTVTSTSAPVVSTTLLPSTATTDAPSVSTRFPLTDATTSSTAIVASTTTVAPRSIRRLQGKETEVSTTTSEVKDSNAASTAEVVATTKAAGVKDGSKSDVPEKTEASQTELSKNTTSQAAAVSTTETSKTVANSDENTDNTAEKVPSKTDSLTEKLPKANETTPEKSSTEKEGETPTINSKQPPENHEQKPIETSNTESSASQSSGIPPAAGYALLAIGGLLMLGSFGHLIFTMTKTYDSPLNEKTFRIPLMPFPPCFAIFVNVYLFLGLPGRALLQAIILLIIVCVLWFVYGFKHSMLIEENALKKQAIDFDEENKANYENAANKENGANNEKQMNAANYESQVIKGRGNESLGNEDYDFKDAEDIENHTGIYNGRITRQGEQVEYKNSSR